MRDSAEQEAEAAERALMDLLFSETGRAHPEQVVRASQVPGCRYAFVRDALHDPRLVAPAMPDSPDLMFRTVARFMSRVPPARHKPLRASFSGLFTPRRVERYRERVVTTTDRLLDALPHTGPVDLVPTVFRPLPLTVIAAVLGLPEERDAWLADRVETFGRAVAGQRDHTEVERGNAATADLLAVFDDELRRREQEPGEDLLTLLSEHGAAGADRDDVLANCLFFVLAGHTTTTALLSSGVELLLEHPDQLARLRAEPGGWPDAVEELLRHSSPTTLTAVRALEDVEVAGCPVPGGAQRALVLAAANRDPAVFDDPDTFDTTRHPNPHLAFAAGAHHCLGAPLARLHAEVALPRLWTRHPDLRAAGPAEWIGSVPVRQVAHLPVTWG